MRGGSLILPEQAEKSWQSIVLPQPRASELSDLGLPRAYAADHNSVRPLGGSTGSAELPELIARMRGGNMSRLSSFHERVCPQEKGGRGELSATECV